MGNPYLELISAGTVYRRRLSAILVLLYNDYTVGTYIEFTTDGAKLFILSAIDLSKPNFWCVKLKLFVNFAVYGAF